MLSLTLAVSLLSGCVSSREESDSGDTSGEVQQTSGGEVNVYNWGEYIDESVLEDFEEATGIHDPLRLYDRPDDRGGHAGAPEF